MDFWFSLTIFTSCLVAYMIGSVNLSIILSKTFFKKDLREYGSGNAGLTNANRTMGKGVAAAVLVWDVAKPIIAILIAQFLLFPAFGRPYDFTEMITFIIGFWAFFGHICPIWHGFKGGKGILTAAGTVLLFDWKTLLIALAVFLILIAVTRIVSIASLGAAVTFPIARLVFDLVCGVSLKSILVDLLLTGVMSAILIFGHRGNIKRLIKGEEKKFTDKVEMQ
jgi:Predicted membrane protein